MMLLSHHGARVDSHSARFGYRVSTSEVRTARRRHRANSRRAGVASILSMMFMVIFGSLAAAMGVVAYGNMRTAHSSLQVNRAMSAAETGLVFAVHRLQQESSQFIVDKGVIDAGFAERLWMGGPYLPSDGNVESPGGSGYGIIHAVRDAHLADGHSMNVAAGDQNLPDIDDTFGVLRVRPIALQTNDEGDPDTQGPHFRLKYELLCSDPSDPSCHPNGGIRVTSQGIDGTIKRTLQVDFQISKRIEFAVISPNRIMIGKNVLVEGPIGSLFGTEPNELLPPNGHPLRMRSDFYFLNDSLSAQLDSFFQSVRNYDVDGDNRLRPNHPVESQGLGSFTDVTGNGFVDEFDIFLSHYAGGNAAVYDASLAGSGANFTDDNQLGRLVDLARPDRDGDGEITSYDTLLGYSDGRMDQKDRYAKVHGRLMFAVTREQWESAHGGIDYREVVQGPIWPGIDRAPVLFGVGEDDLRAITTDMFDNSSSWFAAKAEDNFVDQALNQSGGEIICPDLTVNPNYDPSNEPWWVDSLCPSPDTTHPGWEEVPLGANPDGGIYDYFLRPIFRDMTFTNVKIPRGLNALFENCTFIGVTYIDTDTDNEHFNWNIAGAVIPTDDDPDEYELHFGAVQAILGDGTTVVTDTRPHANNIRFHDCTFLGSISGEKPEHYTHWRNKIQLTGMTRFYLDPDDPDLLAQDDAAQLQAQLNTISTSDREELAKSSILMPGWSMDVGSFISDVDADPDDVPVVKLRGTIVAGILDIRGKADVHGTLLMTFRPKAGEHPLTYYPTCHTCAGNFSTTIGYWGPTFGDLEGLSPDDDAFAGFGEIRLRYDPDAALPDGIPWPIRVDPRPMSYNEGGSI